MLRQPFAPRPLLVLTLSLATACGGGGGGGGGAPDPDDDGGGIGGPGGLEVSNPGRVPDPAASELRVSPAFGTPADGQTSIEIEALLVNHAGRPIRNALIGLTISGSANVWEPLPATDSDGRTRGTLASFAGERKTITAVTGAGGVWTGLEPCTAEFQLIGAETYFVRVSGSDANSGRAPREAWGTLAHALASAGPGATIHVGAGLHAGPLRLTHDSRGTRPLWLAGDPTGVRTGDAGAVVIEAGGFPFALQLDGAHHVVVQGLTLRGAEIGLDVRAASAVRVLACEPAENEHGIVIAGAEDLVLQDCRIDRNRQDGVRLEDTRGVRIENNLIYANGASGLVLRAPAEDTLVRFNTFYGNGGPHLYEESPGGLGKVEENILADGLGAPVALTFGSGYRSCNNITWGHPISRSQTPSGYLEANPLLSDPFGPDGILGAPGSADDDFRLLPGSIALDLGAHLAPDVVLASLESLATRTSRVDEVLEASGDDRVATNLGHHAPLAEPDFESLPVGGVRFAYVAPGAVRAHAGAWTGAQPTVSAAQPGPLLDAAPLFVEQRLSPLRSREELLAAQVSTGTQGRILVRHWDGRRWNEPALAPFVDGIPLAEVGDRRFDLEYEALSGRALLVAAGADGVPFAQRLERGRWGVPEAVPSGPDAGRVRWVELVARRGTDELALVTLDDQRDLSVTLWDGASWSVPRLLETNVLFRPSWRPFDAAFESLSGDLLVSWGFSAFAEETRWATLERASGEWRSGQHVSTDAVGAHIVLAPDPSSDRIAAAMGEADNDNDVTVSVWDGTTWVHTAELTLAGPLSSRLLEVVWIGATGQACVVFRRAGPVGVFSFNFAILQPTGWRVQPNVALPGVERAAQVRLVSLPERGELLGLVLDEQGELYPLRFDGRRFALLDGGQPFATGLDPAAPGRSFDAAALPGPAPTAP
jgi:parallel beta-helix repeat protein